MSEKHGDGRRLAVAAPLAAVLGCFGAPDAAIAQQLEAECPDEVSAEVHQRGEQLFADFCVRCHHAIDLAERIQRADDPEEAASKMIGFLSRHGSCDMAADEAIVRYLSTLRR